MRTCTSCKIEKPEERFPPRRPSQPNKVRTQCRACVNDVERTRRSRSDGAHAAYLRKYRAENRDYRRKWNLWAKYRITPEHYDRMLEAQGGVCGICRGLQDRVSRDGSLWFDVDHDHQTGHVRGLLCHSCNTGIGKLKDSTEILRQAIKYLEDIGA